MNLTSKGKNTAVSKYLILPCQNIYRKQLKEVINDQSNNYFKKFKLKT